MNNRKGATLPNIAEDDVWREGQVWSQIGPVNLSVFSTDMLNALLPVLSPMP